MPLLTSTSSMSALRTTACRNLKAAASHSHASSASSPASRRKVFYPSTAGNISIAANPNPNPNIIFRKYGSTTATAGATSTSRPQSASSAPSSSSSASFHQQPPPPQPALDWESFFRLRRLKRRYNRISSILTAFLGTAVGASVLGNKEVDIMNTQLFGLDMLTLFGLAIAGSGVVGWLAGPAAGGPLFKVMNRRVVGAMAEKEKEFFKHIKRNRVDPSSQSYNNPVPDYYGEKIGSLKEYRQWLKDQRAYNRKKSQFL